MRADGPSGAVVRLPAGESAVEVGATLGIVFGQGAARLPPEAVPAAIAGYVVVADLNAQRQAKEQAAYDLLQEI